MGLSVGISTPFMGLKTMWAHKKLLFLAIVPFCLVLLLGLTGFGWLRAPQGNQNPNVVVCREVYNTTRNTIAVCINSP